MSKLVGAKVAQIYGLWPLMHNPELLLKKIGLTNSRVYHDLPKACCICEGHNFSDLSLVGIDNKPVFFECDRCGALHLKCKKVWLKGQFKALDDIMSDNPEEWKVIPKKRKYN